MTLITPAAPVEARTLTLAIGDGPTEGFDPVMGWSHTGNPLFQSTLIQRTHDFSYENELIESYQISQDGKTWTITLKPARLFSDGSPLTSKDVA
ncbi:MAG: ABC transporter substrate-binding protein, partial [Plesiomonas shigelloides]